MDKKNSCLNGNRGRSRSALGGQASVIFAVNIKAQEDRSDGVFPSAMLADHIVRNPRVSHKDWTKKLEGPGSVRQMEAMGISTMSSRDVADIFKGENALVQRPLTFKTPKCRPQHYDFLYRRFVDPVQDQARSLGNVFHVVLEEAHAAIFLQVVVHRVYRGPRHSADQQKAGLIVRLFRSDQKPLFVLRHVRPVALAQGFRRG